MSTTSANELKSWGFHINRTSVTKGRKNTLPDGCPEWANWQDIDAWCTRGLVVWNSVSGKVISIPAKDALRLLENLESAALVEGEDIQITKQVHQVTIHNSLTCKKSKKSQGQQEKVEEQAKEKSFEVVNQECLRLPFGAKDELKFFLLGKKTELEEMMDRDEAEEKYRRKLAMECFLELMVSGQEQALKQSSESSLWHQLPNKHIWIRNADHGRASIYLAEDGLRWHVEVQNGGKYCKSNYWFIRILDAVAWAEEELSALTKIEQSQLGNINQEQQLTKEEKQARLREYLNESPYRVDPDRLEPEQITYRVFLDLYCRPVSYKTGENHFGESFTYDKVYPKPNKFAQIINLDPDLFSIEPVIGTNTDWYIFESLTVFYDVQVVQLVVCQT